ncbi:MAG: 30S ribosome-binding factor RbfA [Anaerolineales bacterium]|nr:30S ribosome-binding factor RbfA [Anaerolineales bacterium]
MASEARVRKVADRIAEEIADILLRETEDQRLSQISVMGVQVDRELAFATIYVSSYLSETEDSEILRALEGAKGFLRSQLAARIPLHSFPQLRFKLDTTSTQGARIDDLLAGIRQERKQNSREQGED